MPRISVLLLFALLALPRSVNASVAGCGAAFDDTPESRALAYQIHSLDSNELDGEPAVSKAFRVTYDDQNTGRSEAHSFIRTNSGIWNLTYVPKDFVTREGIQGKSVLDVGAGGGQVVFDLRQLGADAQGVDLLLNPQQKEMPFFAEASANALPYADGTFDFVISANSIFDASYARQSSDAFLTSCLSELGRVLKPGGHAYLHWADSPRVRVLLRSVPVLSVTPDPALPGTLILRRD